MFVKEEHQGAHVLSLWHERRGAKGQVHVSYKLLDGSKHRCTPRAKVKHLDPLSDIQIREILDAQIQNRIQEVYPEFFLKHRNSFIRFLNKTAKAVTIQAYISYLGRHVFPYFAHLGGNFEKWQQRLLQWETFLEARVSDVHSRNVVRTALRKYFRYLFKMGETIQFPTILNEPEKARAKPLPGDRLATTEELIAWLDTIPNLRKRWAYTTQAAFGIRISESIFFLPSDIIDAEAVESYADHKHIINRARQLGTFYLFADISRAYKKATKLEKILGEPDEDPKQGPYIAGCTDQFLAQYLVELASQITDWSEDPTYNELYSVIRENPFFMGYTAHDWRKWHITLLALLISDFFLVGNLHGHKSESTTRIYFQFEMTRRRKHGTLGKQIKLIGDRTKKAGTESSESRPPPITSPPNDAPQT